MSSSAAPAADAASPSRSPQRHSSAERSDSPEPKTSEQKRDKGKQRAPSEAPEDGAVEDQSAHDQSAPPLPEEEPPLPQEEPPLPDEAPPTQEEDDGWAPVWDATAGAYYFYNRFTQATQWENPRVPEASVAPAVATAPGVAPGLPANPLAADTSAAPPRGAIAGGYDPAIHGSYDENAWYAQRAPSPPPTTNPLDPTNSSLYEQTGTFNRFTGRWQASNITPENFNDENKSRRQMNAFFDVDLAANSHDGKSLRAERASKKLSKSEVKQFKQKRKMKKEEKRRAWLLD